MSERKSVTRARLAQLLDDHLPRMALHQYGQGYNADPDFDIEAYYDRVASAIFDALPATPAASGDVEAARAALLDRLQPLLAGEHYEAVRAMMAFEAAIRAEHAGALDVERLSSLVLAALAEWTGEPSDGVSAAIRRAIASKVAAEYTRLADPTP